MRLINAETLKEKWYEINDIDENDRGARFVGYSEIARLIDQTPTVPIGDLISRQALIDAIEKCGEEKIYPQALIETIKALPSADRPKGEWIRYKRCDPVGDEIYAVMEAPDGKFFCNQCGKSAIKSDFCPHCGADMKGE